MALTEIDPNLSSRNSLSRASNLSGKTSNKGSQHGIATDSLSTNAGVISMLRTTTEMGDIGVLTNRPSRLPRRPAGPPRRSSNLGHSRASSHYSRAGSINSRASSNHSNPDLPLPGSWQHRQFPQARSIDLPVRDEYGYPKDQPDSASASASASINGGSDRFDVGQRSYSLTNSRPLQFKSNRHLPAPNWKYHGQLAVPPRSPYRQPLRVREPAYRPGSPAHSDGYPASYNRAFAFRPTPGLTAFTKLSKSHDGPLNEHSQGGFGPRFPAGRQYDSTDVEERPYPQARAPQHANPEIQTWRSSPLQVSGNNFESQGRTVVPFRSSPSPLRKTNNVPFPATPTFQKPGDTAPYAGFVQRVKQVLEERASVEEAPIRRGYDRPRQSFDKPADEDVAVPNASPVARRLTREMIKAAVGPPSETGALSPEAPGSVISNVREVESTGDGSSDHAQVSLDMARPLSFPDITQSGSTEAQKTPSSNDTRLQVSVRTTKSFSNIVPSAAFETSKAHLDMSKDALDIVHDSRDKQDTRDPRGAPWDERSHILGRTPDRPASFPSPDRQTCFSTDKERQSLPTPATRDIHPSQTAGQITESNNGMVADARPSMSSVHSATTIMPSSAPSSVHSISRPGSVTDLPTWATSSIIARRSFDPDYTRRSSVSIVAEQQLPSRMTTIAAVRPTLPTLNENEAVQNTVMNTGAPSTTAVSASSVFPETRLSIMKPFQCPLPDLTEDSQEEHSTTNLRMLGSRPPPTFRSGRKMKRTEARMLGRSDPPFKALAPVSSYLSHKLADSRNMPSLHFSQIDLTTKLNIALGLKTSTSIEPLENAGCSRLTVFVEESDTVTEKKERYRSFFSESGITEEIKEPSVEPFSEQAEPGLDLMHEIDRLSIPSVNGLTVRLSELLPSIKKGGSFLDLTKSDYDVENTVDDVRELGVPERMASLEWKRASLISALTAGTVAQSRRGGSARDDRWLPRGLSDADTMKDLPRLPTECQDPRPSIATTSTAHGVSSAGSGMMPRVLPDVKSAMQPKSSNGSQQQVEELGMSAMLKSDPKLVVASENKADEGVIDDTLSLTTGAADVTLDIGVLQRDPARASRANASAKMRKSRLRTLAPEATERIVRSMSPGPHLETNLVPQSEASIELDRARPTRKGIIGSLQRKIGVRSGKHDLAGFPLDPEFLHPGERIVSGPGDRYPTTALTPPQQANIDDTRSYFSDDSSIEEEIRARNLRKRLTQFKMRYSAQQFHRRAPSRAQSNHEVQSERYPPQPWEGSNRSASAEAGLDSPRPNVVVVYDQTPSGMSKLEFRAKRLVEKLRLFWCRSGAIVRSLSRTQKQPPSFYEESEMYEGT